MSKTEPKEVDRKSPKNRGVQTGIVSDPAAVFTWRCTDNGHPVQEINRKKKRN